MSTGPGTDARYDAWLTFALDCCDAADALALEHFRRDLVITTKPDRTFVTQADTAIEAALRERIAAAYPDHGLVGEEYGTAEGSGTVRWYIDPIDGTHNFMRGVPLFGTLLAAEEDGELVVGVMSAPALGERWYARRGGGAWAVSALGPEAGRPRRIGVSSVAALSDAQLLYASPLDIEASGEAPGFDALIRSAWRDRGFGDFWGYALVAEGAAEAMIEVGPNSWDLAAPVVVVEEAGGRMTDLHGARTIHGGTSLASNGILHDEIVRRLAG
ncbi:MAG TPA: inositol monophosphatase family protein [Candidatus Limnocylindrales bacterium]|nr:inositol monophosphatase family protein [Candidatus Limnocylindrales bacterium]